MMASVRFRFAFCSALILAFILTACVPALTATPFIPPEGENLANTANAPIYTPPPQPTAPSSTPGLVNPGGNLSACTDNLSYVEDVSIPDGTIVAPGEQMEKIWRVENSGTCGWDSRYRLRLDSGEELGAQSEQALYPARAGTQLEIHLLFTAPQEAGYHRTAWQAYGPDGNPFGDQIYMDIVVQYP
jgi:hypothetical protein